ncbi:LOW QUALITY PROTEIN: hypothetical protein TorRG33x02_190530, partial [Trema orientale]
HESPCRDNDRARRSPRKARSTSLHQCSSRPKPKRIETWVSPENPRPSFLSSPRTIFPSISHSIESRAHLIAYTWNPSAQSKPRSWICSLFPAPVAVGLDDRTVFAQELEIDLVLGPVALEGGEVEVEVEAAGVAAGAAYLGAEGAVAEGPGGAPPSAAAVVEGEGDEVGVGAVSAGLWVVVYGDLFQGLGLMERWSLWFRRRSWLS